MFGLLTLAFLAVPIVEIWLLFQVGGAIGAAPTLGLIVVTAVAGAALARHQGLAAIRGVQRSLQTGQEVGLSVVEAAMVLAAAVMLLLPGFITDGVGLALLIPLIRRPVARAAIRRFSRGRGAGGPGFVVVDVGGFDGVGGAAPGADDDPPPPGVIDV